MKMKAKDESYLFVQWFAEQNPNEKFTNSEWLIKYNKEVYGWNG